jgi:hypothetical protein
VMKKFKHNKKRNTAFLYESLVLELTKAILTNERDKQFTIKSMIRENFHKNTTLFKDLSTYNALVETKGVDKEFASKILNEAKNQKKQIDKKQLFNEQNKLIQQINTNFSKNFFSNFVPNYKHLASVFQIFNTEMPIKSKVLLENELIDLMSEENKTADMLPIDTLTYKIFIDKFNKKYGDALLEEQKALLENYIISFKDNGLELKCYLNEEIGRLKSEVYSIQTNKKEDTIFVKKLDEVLAVLNSFSESLPDESMITKIISTQSLVKEMKEDVN